MFIKCLKVGSIRTNCYIVCDRIANIAVIIDPGSEPERIEAALADTGCKAEYLLLTHGHFDHIFAVKELSESTGAKVVAFDRELPLLRDPLLNLSTVESDSPVSLENPDIVMKDGEKLSAGPLEFTFIHTPGHTHGSCSIICQDTIFSGDTLFKDSIGRTDLPTSSFQEMMGSLKRLKELPGDYQVLPGHGAFTKLDYERKNNPFMKKDDDETVS